MARARDTVGWRGASRRRGVGHEEQGNSLKRENETEGKENGRNVGKSRGADRKETPRTLQGIFRNATRERNCRERERACEANPVPFPSAPDSLPPLLLFFFVSFSSFFFLALPCWRKVSREEEEGVGGRGVSERKEESRGSRCPANAWRSACL